MIFMWKHKVRNVHQRNPGLRRPSRRVRPVELTRLELLDRRVLPAVTATFSAAQGVLTVIGDARDNSIVVSSDSDAMSSGGSPTMAKGGLKVQTSIKVDGIDGCNHNETQAKGGLKVQTGIKACGIEGCNHNEAQVRDA
jgi:hypothetical protein